MGRESLERIMQTEHHRGDADSVTDRYKIFP